MIRIVCKNLDYSLSGPGGTAVVKFETFDIESPELEAWLRAHRQGEVIGAQVRETEEPHEPA